MRQQVRLEISAIVEDLRQNPLSWTWYERMDYRGWMAKGHDRLGVRMWPGGVSGRFIGESTEWVRLNWREAHLLRKAVRWVKRYHKQHYKQSLRDQLLQQTIKETYETAKHDHQSQR